MAYLVSEDGQALLEGELEPVPASHAVAGSVVEVLVPDYALDARVVHVRGCGRAGKHQAAVEDVERPAAKHIVSTDFVSAKSLLDHLPLAHVTKTR